MNHEIGKPEAPDIRVSMSSLVRFVTEQLAADSVRPPRFHLALAPSLKFMPICKDESGFLNHVI